MSHGKSNAICVVAILKEEDPFVEEWIAYHRLLGIDHFFLYDDDPRQPLNDLLARHQDYVTIRPWLVEHHDKRYPGRTKQLKAYLHSLDHGAKNYDWVAFIDCDEFISFETHADIKAFLAEFDGYDSISLNWHVFGHNGYYENPPGLVIECLTRRMKEPRAMTKTLTRPDAIASMDTPHFCRLKSGRKRVDANKRAGDELYPGKTSVARINHYQCRSFLNWMQKVDRGEVGALVGDPDNAWRFTPEGCLRKFVTAIALDKNEFVDTSMLRHVQPVEAYLSRLHGGSSPQITSDRVGQPKTSLSQLFQGDQSSPSRAAAGPNLTRFALTKLAKLKALRRSASVEIQLLQFDFPKAYKFLWAVIWDRNYAKRLIDLRIGRSALHRATLASQSGQWAKAALWWRIAIDKFGSDAPPGAYAQLSKALLNEGDQAAARDAALQGWAKHPADSPLARSCAKFVKREEDWSRAAAVWRSAIEALDETPPAELFLWLARTCRRQGRLDEAQEFIGEAESARRSQPSDLDILVEQAEIAWASSTWDLLEESSNAAMALIEAEPSCTIAPRSFFAISTALLLSGQCDRVIAAVQKIKERHQDSRWVCVIEGLAYLRASRMEEADRIWTADWQRALEDRGFASRGIPPFLSPAAPSRSFFSVVTPSDPSLAQEDVRFCIYTVLIGDYDELRPPAFTPPGVDFICLSDRERNVAGWQVRIVDVDADTPAKASRLPKILPYEFLGDYDCSLYIDANVVLLIDPLRLYHKYLKGRPFVSWCHPHRSSVYEEIEANLMWLRHEPGPLLRQYEFFRAESVPQQTGLVEAGFLWRDHRDPAVRTLMEQWWDCLIRFNVYRDQPSLAYLMWRTGIRPEVMPEHLGTTRNNEIYEALPHKLRDGAAEDCSSPTVQANRTATNSGRVRPAQRRLTWIYHSSHKSVASTLMRGHQLTDLIRLRLPEMNAECVDESRLGAQFDSVLMLTKGFLKETNFEELALLKECGNIICADYVDDPARDDLHACIDVYVASSITQFIAYAKEHRDKYVHLITHHADPRLNGFRAPQDRCRIGYFGEIVNARYASELRDRIQFHLVNTKVSEAGWLEQLGDYNVHYAVRQHRAIDGFKPFVKGFTAAHCRSNIIVGNEDREARYYLGSDYPYILKDSSLKAVMEMIEYAETSFGTAEWRRGMEIMDDVRRRCTPEQVAEEIRTLLARYL